MTPPNITISPEARKCLAKLQWGLPGLLGQLIAYQEQELLQQIQLAINTSTEALAEWKTAVEDACIVLHLGEALNKPPRECLHHLICYENQIALDPQVSGEAAKLRDTYLSEKEALAKENAELREELKILTDAKEGKTEFGVISRLLVGKGLLQARVKLLEQENAQNNAASVTFDLCEANARVEELEAMLREFAGAAKSFSDSRISYEEIQICRGLQEDAMKLLQALNPPTPAKESQ